MIRGDYVELSIRREVVEDGSGGEQSGVVVRVWGAAETFEQDGDQLLIAELRLPDHQPPGPPSFPPASELIEHVLSCLELDR